MGTEDMTTPHRPGEWASLLFDCIAAVWCLGIGRLQLLSLTPRDIVALNERAWRLARHRDDAFSAAAVRRVAFAVPRVAARLPWRTDCLVQALAARRWLAYWGIPTQVAIGVDRNQGGAFSAHAWLKHDEIIVTGGETSQFTVLLAPKLGS